MSRPRSFDEDQVLDGAMRAFWAKGFDATTLDDLEAVTGLGRGSLYGAFGDKRALFLKAVERYVGHAIERHATELDPARGKAAIVGFFTAVCRDATDCARAPGCMLTNCAVELAARDADVAARVDAHLTALENRLVRVVQAAQARGEIAAERDAVGLARVLIAALQGIQVLAKARPDGSWLRGLERAIEASL